MSCIKADMDCGISKRRPLPENKPLEEQLAANYKQDAKKVKSAIPGVK